MLSKLIARWKSRRANDGADGSERGHRHERGDESPEEQRASQNHGPGGWTPIGDLSKLSEDE
jgi:hypothetical protein